MRWTAPWRACQRAYPSICSVLCNQAKQKRKKKNAGTHARTHARTKENKEGKKKAERTGREGAKTKTKASKHNAFPSHSTSPTSQQQIIPRLGQLSEQIRAHRAVHVPVESFVYSKASKREEQVAQRDPGPLLPDVACTTLTGWFNVRCLSCSRPLHVFETADIRTTSRPDFGTRPSYCSF